jgi:hypothetical protein
MQKEGYNDIGSTFVERMDNILKIQVIFVNWAPAAYRLREILLPVEDLGTSLRCGVIRKP